MLCTVGSRLTKHQISLTNFKLPGHEFHSDIQERGRERGRKKENEREKEFHKQDHI